MKRRLTRAKAKIKATAIPFAVPAAHLLPDRLDAVLAVIYLIYNEGTAAGSTSALKPSGWGECSPHSCRTRPKHSGCSR
jgi:predicted RNA polymerase sigma factor